MKIFCIDIGNTHAHFGAVVPGRAATPLEVATWELDRPDAPFARAVEEYGRETPPRERAFSFCSVVPSVNDRLRAFVADKVPGSRLFQLTCHARLGMDLSYPRPEEIGQDRLANAVAATAFHSLPCVVIDTGTAVTFDIVTASGGYEGGIIAPGLRVMNRYLHEQTALLPSLDEDFEVAGAIGKSTADAMRIGCLIGFGGMVRALLEAVEGELVRRGESSPKVLQTGGTARFLRSLSDWNPQPVPDLTLQGLAHAWVLNHPGSDNPL